MGVKGVGAAVCGGSGFFSFTVVGSSYGGSEP